MKDDDVLAQLRDHVRGDRADDAALEAVARGETRETSAAIAELESRAQTDATVQALLAASRPLGPDAQARIAMRVAAPQAGPARALAARPTSLRVVRRIGIVAAPLLLAAAIALRLTTGRDGEGERLLLPEYTVAVTSEQTMRGPVETSAVPGVRLRGGDARFEIVLRPAAAAPAKVVAFVFAIGEGEPNPLDGQVEVAPEGAVRIRARGHAIDGAHEVRIVIGTAGDSAARFEQALAHARDGQGDAHLRVLTVPITRE